MLTEITKNNRQEERRKTNGKDDKYSPGLGAFRGFLQPGGRKKWKLEDFLEEDSGKQEKAPGLNTAAETGARLEEMAELVRQVTALSGHGNTADQIAGALGVERKLVQDIMVCLQAFPEDNPVAVARLIVLG